MTYTHTLNQAEHSTEQLAVFSVTIIGSYRCTWQPLQSDISPHYSAHAFMWMVDLPSTFSTHTKICLLAMIVFISSPSRILALAQIL